MAGRTAGRGATVTVRKTKRAAAKGSNQLERLLSTPEFEASKVTRALTATTTQPRAGRGHDYVATISQVESATCVWGAGNLKPLLPSRWTLQP